MNNWQKIKAEPYLKQSYLIREVVNDTIRSYFKGQGFHEVETPLLVPQPGTEPYLEVYETTLKTWDGRERRGFLTTSPELQMKKLLTAGLGNIFQICKSFRNGEGIGHTHNTEFSILEWYRVNADYTAIMSDFETMFLALVTAVGKEVSSFKYQGVKYDLTPPWPRISIAEAFYKFAGVDTEALVSEDLMVKAAQAKGYMPNQKMNWEEAYGSVLANEVEPALAKLNQPVFLYDYPVSQAALSRKKISDPRFAERFEVYLGGMELGNAFSELTDACEQKKRMEADLVERAKLGKTAYGLDRDFIEALELGMPEAAGIAVGVDRLVMLMADVADISQVVFFPATEIFELEVK